MANTLTLDLIDPGWAWEAWQPDAQHPWNRKWAGHLFRRAAFGPTPDELDLAEKRGFQATLDLILDGEPRARGIAKFLNEGGAKIARRNNTFELRAWWLYCMLTSGHPLREKMTLFWHNHFATSIAKVGRPPLMFEQNRLMRQHALGKFGPFLLDMSKDAAMLVWLDSNSNLKAHPNENFAREVLELFSLGVGNYTEKDIREAARAFTGWHTDGDVYEFNSKQHDTGSKTIFGQTGNWNGDDVVHLILKQPACASYLARRLFRCFVSELHEPSEKLIGPLAVKLRQSDYRHRPAGAHHPVVTALLLRPCLPAKDQEPGGVRARQRALRLRRQHLAAASGDQAGGAGSEPVRAAQRQGLAGRPGLGQHLDLAGTPELQPAPDHGHLVERVCATRGIAVFCQRRRGGGAPLPPGVKRPDKPEEPPPPEDRDPARIIRKAKLTKPEQVVDHLIDVHLPGGVATAVRAKMVQFIADGKPSAAALDRRVRELVHAIFSTPEYQLA